jgi:hypothetical protein
MTLAGIEDVRIFHNIYYATICCSRNVQMSVPSKLEMSASPVV